MKVWIIKYALTDEIIEANADPILSDCVIVSDIISPIPDRILNKDEWHPDKESAIKKAEEMRQNKIASLKKSD